MSGVAAILPARGAAEIMGRSLAWFYAHRAELEKAGFPKRDKLLAGWHRAAIEAWLAHRAGVAPCSYSGDKEALRRAIDARKDAVRHSAVQ